MSIERSRVVGAAAERELADARALLGDLRETLARVPATDADAATLAGSIRQLDDLFLIVVVGEFNSGKSAFINALTGAAVLEEGVTPTTAEIQLVRYGEAIGSSRDATGLRVVTAPVELLRDLHIVDTPGTNAIVREHERLTLDFMPRADLVLFVTSADRPFTETERVFLDVIRDWGKKIVLVVNKIDILDRASERDEVLGFVRESASRLLNVVPEVFAVSARLAMRAKQTGTADLRASGFEPLERFVQETLDDKSRFHLKLSNPLGVGDTLARRYEAVADERLRLLGDDVAALDDIERQHSAYRDDLAHGFELRMAGVEKVLLEMEARGHAYFEDTLRVGRVFDLLNKPRIQREFEERVVGDAPARIDQLVSEIIDWLVDRDFRQWQALSAKLSVRQSAHGDRILGAPEIGSFHADRAKLLESVGREAQRVVQTYDRSRESAAIADGARTAVAATAAVGAGALGLGTVVTVAATTAAMDVTGMLAAGVIGAVGLLIIPAKRRRARVELREKVSDLRVRLAGALQTEFQTARERGSRRLDDGLAPYARFVRSEQHRWREARATLAAWRARAAGFLAPA
ncbi:MAG TPA: dynamin family protein [Vicinamibacterales bacterium]|nr:dynamin family protein [Vicinamibacterales bacterium]